MYQSVGVIPFVASLSIILGLSVVSVAVWWSRRSITKYDHETIKTILYLTGFGLILLPIGLILLPILLESVSLKLFVIIIVTIIGIVISWFWFPGFNQWVFGDANEKNGILPVINPDRENSGQYSLTSKSDTIFSTETLSSIILPIVILAPLTIGVPGIFLFGLVLAELYGSVDLFNIFNAALFLGTVFLFMRGIYWVYPKIQEFRVLLQMEPGELTLSNWPLKLGDEVKAIYSRTLSEELDIGEVTPRLICKSTYEIPDSDGKSTETKKRIVQKINYSYFKPSNEGSVNHQFIMAIPEEGPPSFERPAHKYEWFLKVDFEIASYPNDSSVIKLSVLPEVAKNS